MDLCELLRERGVAIKPVADGRHFIAVQSSASPGAAPSWTTAYPLDLIVAIHDAKGGYVCDEIMREEDPRYVERAIRNDVLGYVEARAFAGKRVLDFGCGAGAS